MKKFFKFIQNNWLRFCFIALIWATIFLLIYHSPLSHLIRELSIETRLGIIFTIFTTLLSHIIEQQKKRTERLVDEQKVTQQIQSSNQETFVSSIRILEDTIDGIRLELREFQVIEARMAAIESEQVNQKSSYCELGAELQRQDERLKQGDRLLATIGLIGGLINDVAELRTRMGVEQSEFSKTIHEKVQDIVDAKK